MTTVHPFVDGRSHLEVYFHDICPAFAWILPIPEPLKAKLRAQRSAETYCAAEQSVPSGNLT